MKQYIIFLVAILLGKDATAQKNLVSNGDFENGLIGWNGNAAVVSPWIVKNGKHSCAITTYNDNDWAGIGQVCYLSKKTVAIAVSVWAKSEGIQQGKEQWNNGLVSIEFIGAGNKKVSDGENICTVTGTTGWTLYKKTMLVPEGAKSCRVMLAMGNASGSLMIDDVTAIELSAEALAKLNAPAPQAAPAVATFTNGGFEDGAKGWGNYVGELSSDTHNGAKSYLIKTTNSNDWAGIDQKAAIPAGTKAIELSAWLKCNGIIQGKDSWNAGVLILEFSGDGSKNFGYGENVAILTGTQDWKEYKKSIPVPEGATGYRIMVAMSFATGSLFVDDVAVALIK